MKLITTFLLFLFTSLVSHAQHSKTTFSRQDSLRGALRAERNYDVKHYDIDVRIDDKNQTISGSNTILFSLDKDFTSKRLQIDLFNHFEIDSIFTSNNKERINLDFDREGNVVWIKLPKESIKAGLSSLTIYYRGKPQEAKTPPWDGGFTWSEVANNKPWITLSCQGLGASSWLPLKDHLSDEPDSMDIKIEVDKNLVAVSNGRLIQTLEKPNTTIYHWKTTYPINPYNITLNIGDYVRLDDKYVNQINKDTLYLTYYVIKGQEKTAKPFFNDQVSKMLEAFEHLFGEYPFYEDSYKLVQTPYWGMEHQSCIAYGNNFKLNEFGFDFIILHESGHEWFGNSISIKDNGELWIHEAFTTYSEALFVEYFEGYERSVEYLLTQQPKIQNKEPILAPLDVNYNSYQGADMYYKGTWLLHTMRSVVDNDSLWLAIVKDFYQNFKYRQPNTEDVISFFEKNTAAHLRPIFEYYLQNAKLPTLEYKIIDNKKQLRIAYRWANTPEDFRMPVEVKIGEKTNYIWTHPTKKWQFMNIKDAKTHFEINQNRFLVNVVKAD